MPTLTALYRPKGRVAPLVCMGDRAVNRRSNHTVSTPGHKPRTRIPSQKWDIRSCRPAKTVPCRVGERRTSELHVQIWQEVKPWQVNVAAQVVDISGKHIVVGVYTVSQGHHTDHAARVSAAQNRQPKVVARLVQEGWLTWYKLNKRIRPWLNKAIYVKRNTLHWGAVCCVNKAVENLGYVGHDRTRQQPQARHQLHGE